MPEGVMSRLIDHYVRGGILEPRNKCTVPRTPSEMAPEECGGQQKARGGRWLTGDIFLVSLPKAGILSPLLFIMKSCCSSVTKSSPTLFDPMDCSTPDFLVLHHLPNFLKLMSIESVMPSNNLILCHPLLLLPSVFPSIRVFSNELALCIRWPKYWDFSFRISPSTDYSGLIPFRIDWFDLAVQGTLKSPPTP